MGKNVSQQLIGTHLVEGRMEAGQEIGLGIDQTLTQDATGTHGWRVACAVRGSYDKSSTQCTTGTRASWRR